MKKLQWILLFVIFVFYNSCIKYKCEGNCEKVTFKGRVFDATTNEGFNNIQVRAIWSNQNQSYLYPEVASTRTSSNGSFEMSVKINPTGFDNKTLSFQFEAPAGYETRGNLDGNDFYSDISFYDYNASAFQQINFALYPVTEAKIKLVRTQVDSVSAFYMEYSFNNEYPTRFGDLFNNMPQNVEYTIQTSADIYTKIKLVKRLVSGTTITTYDSAIFKQNQQNSIQLFY
jgi:hypothetical protein